MRWQADVAVAGLLMLPLGLAYAVSTSIWLLIAALVAPGCRARHGRHHRRLAAGLAADDIIVAQRLRAPRPAHRARPPTMTAYVPQRPRWRSVFTCGASCSGCRSGAMTI